MAQQHDPAPRPAPATDHLAQFKPYIPASESPPEFTVSSVLLGVFFGVIFGAITVYLALKVGLTVSASIPIAVLSIVVYKALGPVLGKGSVLQNNIVQTTGSAGESIAAGVAFTLPALVFLGAEAGYWRVVAVAIAGGWLGVLFMIPLRRYLIVREHGVLKYPEGTACAEVLIAGERGGSLGLRVLQGVGLGFLYSILMKVLGLWNDTPEYRFKGYAGGSVATEITPELLGVGYIIGYRISAIMVAGGVLTYLVFIPLIYYLGQFMPDVVIFPGTVPIAQMDPSMIRGAYVRYIGAGAVATGGIINVIRAMPVIVDSLRSSIGEMRGKSGAATTEKQAVARTDRDMPITLVAIGSLVVVVLLWAILTFGINPDHAFANVLAAILMVIFGFLFVTVSSRLVGEIGSSSNPISGMTIATLMATCLIFVAVGWTGSTFAAVALCIGAVVCIGSANAGATSQDLKTGFLLGATPASQQIGLMIGVTCSVLVIGGTMWGVDRAYTTTIPTAPAIAQVRFDALTGQQLDEKGLADLRVSDDAVKAQIATEAKSQGLVQETVIGSKVVPDGLYLVGANDHKAHFAIQRGIGSAKLPAPQAQLMATVINGILNQKLPWNLILIGVFAALVLELCGIKSLPFAVGVYLPLSTTSPIFVGGVVKKLVDWKSGVKGEADEGEASTGVLFSSGLIAGGALAGLAGAIVVALEKDKIFDLGKRYLWSAIEGGRESGVGKLVAVAIFCALSGTLYWMGMKKDADPTPPAGEVVHPGLGQPGTAALDPNRDADHLRRDS